MIRLNVIIASTLLLSACGANLAEYEPVVDPYNTDMTNFKGDLIQCRGIASEVKVKYEEQASKQALANAVAGAVSGAVVGAAVGSNTSYQGELAAYGAASGAAAGSAASAQYYSLARYGPNRIVDRCMSNRGYTILNDLGAGINY